MVGEFPPGGIWAAVCGRLECPHWKPGMGSAWYAGYREWQLRKRAQENREVEE